MHTNAPDDGLYMPAGGSTYTGGGFRSHVVLIVLFIIYMSDYADRNVVSSIIDFIKDDWNITDTQAGWLMSVVLMFITIFSVPFSMLVDKWSRRKMVSIMTFFWSLATLACKYTKTFPQLLVARAFIGIGESAYSSAGAAMLSAAYPEEKRAKILGIWNASIPLGIGIGMSAGGWIARNWGWHHAFGAVAVPGMFLAVAAWFLPDYKTVRRYEPSAGFSGFDEMVLDLKSILRTRSLMFNYIALAMAVSCTTAMSTWLPVYFERVGTVEKGQGGALATPLFALVLVGVPLGGYLADLWQKKRKNARMLLSSITSFIAAYMLLLAFLNPGHKYQFAMLVVYGITVTCFVAPTLAVIQDLVHPGMRAFAIGMGVLFQHLLGDIWSPILIGRLSDMFGKSHGLISAVLFIPIYGLLASIFYYIGSLSYAEDVEKVEKVELAPEK